MSISVEERLQKIMPEMKGKAVRHTTWKRFSRGMLVHDIVDAFHESACNIPEYAKIDSALVTDIIRGRIQYYLNVRNQTVEQIAGTCGQPSSILREIIAGGASFASITAPVVEKDPRPVRGTSKAGVKKKLSKKKKATKKAKSVRSEDYSDEAADRCITTIQALLDGDIAEEHTEMVLRGLARYAHEQRLPFANKIESGLTLVGQIPSEIALLGVLDVCQ